MNKKITNNHTTFQTLSVRKTFPNSNGPQAITFMINTKKPITPQFQTWINHLSNLDI